MSTAESALFTRSISTVERPALLDRLDDRPDAQITAVIAPAGSGKTVLVRSWLDARHRTEPAAWVSVARSEQDPQRFWSSVALEFRKSTAPDETVTGVGPAPVLNADTVVHRLTKEIIALESGLTIVIDDVHEIRSSDITNQLTRFLDSLPRNVRVVLISRHDPQLGLHRRRLEGDLNELRVDELRFTLEEARALLAAAGISISDDSLQMLHQRTEGWAAGLRLAALALASRSDAELFVREFSGSERTVAQYLLAEVLDRQAPEVRRLLVRASIVDRVNGALGDLLTGGTGSEGTLSTLADEGSFVIRVDATGEWYRFHHLFGDLLAAELRHSDASALPGLHKAVAAWYHDNGYVLEAIHHSLAADDHDLVVTLLVEHYFSLMLDGRQASAREMLNAAVARSSRPELVVLLAADELVAGSLEAAAAQLDLAERTQAEVAEECRDRFEVMLYLCRLTLARRVGDFRAIPGASPPGSIFSEPRSEKDLSMQIDLRAWLLMNRGIVEVWSGMLDEGEQHLLEAGEIARKANRPYLLASCYAHRAQALTWRSFTRALPVAREALAIAEAAGQQDDPVAGVAHVVEGACLVATGRLELAEEAFRRADHTLRSDLEPAIGLMLQTGHGVISLLHARYPEAIESFLHAERFGKSLAVSAPLTLQATCAAMYAAVLGGNDLVVQTALAELTDTEKNSGEVREVIAARAIAQGDAAAAVAALKPILDQTTPMHHGMVLIRSLLLNAHAHYVLGDEITARKSVERALDLAEGDGLVDPFLWVNSRELLERHRHRPSAHRAFVAAIHDVLSGREVQAERRKPGQSGVDMSETELRVLRYLPTNLTAAEIAGEIFLSVNTIKTHMRSIYTKVDAHNRGQAVQAARDLGLLSGKAPVT